MQLTLTRKFATVLLNEARQSPESRIYGFISENNDKSLGFYPSVDTERETRESIEGTKLSSNEHLIAAVESRPDSPALPEPAPFFETNTDLHKFYISLNTKGVLEMRAFQHLGDTYEEIIIAVEG